MLNEELIIFPKTPQQTSTINPQLVHPMSAFISRAVQKAQNNKKAPSTKIVIQRKNYGARHSSLTRPLPLQKQYLDLDQILYKRKIMNQKASSLGRKVDNQNLSVGFDDPPKLNPQIQVQKLQRLQRKLQTNGDEFDDNQETAKKIPFQITYHESKRLLQSYRGRNMHDIDKTKIILQNILTGMQHKLEDMAQERHMKIYGMQIRTFNEQPPLKKRENREPSRSFAAEEVELKNRQDDKKKRDVQSTHQRRKQSPSNAEKKKVISQINIRPQSNANFKFALTDYSQLSREQMFQVKLGNYHYFLFLVSTQSNFYTPPQQQIEFKFKVGRGNNSLLLKEAFKNRWWWTLFPNSEPDKDMNFIWTQIKVASYMSQQSLSHVINANQTHNSSLSSLDIKRRKTQSTKDDPMPFRKNERFGKFLDPLQKLMSEQQATILKTIEKQTCDYQAYAEKQDFKLLTPNENYKIHNHIEKNYHLGNKKAMFHNLKKYYDLTKQDLFSHVPVTFHIQNGTKDKAYQQFLEFYRSLGKKQTTWIVKPGEFTNRGTGIQVCQSLQEIQKIVNKKQKHANGKPFTYLIQKYIDKPMLYNKRKFDLRCYFMITQLNNVMRAYWYEEGYIRTASEEFNLKDVSNQYIHLTNDAIQKFSDGYGKFESGNKLSFIEFQRYLDMWHSQEKYDFFKDLYPQLKTITTNAIKAVYYKLEPHKKEHNFEVFGLDFMIDDQFRPWLIEINTNPCLELSCPLLGRIIPAMIENALRLSLDTLVPPPDASVWPPCKKHLIFYDNVMENNRFQIIFDEQEDGPELKNLFSNEAVQDAIDEMDEDEEEYRSDDD